VRYQLGYVLYRERRLELAKAEFKAVVDLAPPALYSKYYLGRIALMEGRPKEAVDWLEPPAHAETPVMDALAQLGKAYFESGRTEDALVTLQEVSRQAPWEGAVHYQLGRIYRRLGQTGLARDEFATSERLKAADRLAVEKILTFSQHLAKGEKAPATRIYQDLITDRGADPDVLISIGVLLGNAGLENEALEPFRIAADRNPGFFQAQYNCGLTLLKLGRAVEAEAPLGKAVLLQPESFDANSALALAYVGQGRHADATVALETAHRLRSSSMRIAGLLASAYLRTGKSDKSLVLLRKVMARDASDSKLHYLLIEALRSAKDDEGSLKAAQDAAGRFPELPQTHLFVAQELLRAGRYHDAGSSFERVTQLDPGNVEAKLGLAEVLQKKGDFEASLVSYRAVLALDALNLAAQIGIAKDLALLKRFAEAREFLEVAVPQHPDNAALRYELARAYARLGDSASAAEQTRIFQQLHEQEPQ
jgi:Flp pilus assembly protein TadD